MSDNPMDIFLKMHALEKKRNELLERCDKLQAENERLVSLIREVISGEWCVTDLQEAIGDL